ncbi:MAG TPA: hypothetical protein VF688_11155 [Allosphingosinicella sp.]|jgi:hypothetical protein
MTNPFLRRATEYIRDDSAFLSIVSPEPLTTFIAPHAKKGLLFDLPVRVIGTPGSGKTMMAMLAEFRLVESIMRNQHREGNRALASALAQCGFIQDGVPSTAAVRIPMESEYRDFWELPYDESVRTRLIFSLVQARSILSLFRNLTAERRRKIGDIKFILKDDGDAQLDQIGGATSEGIYERAREVEAAVYPIGSSLLPPDLSQISDRAREPYQPFEVIREIEISWIEGNRIRLKPLVILDDVHTLHPDQLGALFRILARREMRIGRWLMMRLDTLTPTAAFRSPDEAIPGMKAGRDYLDIFMQSQGTRGDERKQFRKMASDMANRYLALVKSLQGRHYTQFAPLLPEEPPQLPPGKLEELKELVDREQRALEIHPNRREKIAKIVDLYARSAKGGRGNDTGEEVRLAMQRILLHRYRKRLEGKNLSLFDTDPEPPKPLKANAGIAEGARLQLHKRFGRPVHYGFSDLCDASNENAELFLQLAGRLVARMETKAIRNLDPALTPAQQQAALATQASEMIDNWGFPYARRVRDFIDWLAAECDRRTQAGNASLGQGANAIAIEEKEMPAFLAGDSELLSVLKFAIAYGALIAVRNYGQGSTLWCLLELSGPVCLKYGLTLKRGGFIESSVDELLARYEEI